MRVIRRFLRPGDHGWPLTGCIKIAVVAGFNATHRIAVVDAVAYLDLIALWWQRAVFS